jgi:agmatine/peptidylarginine deiminase
MIRAIYGLLKTSAFVSVIVAAACGVDDDLQSRLAEGSDEVLAELLPADLFAPVSKNKEMLPAHRTAAEATAQLKADGWDPRDNHASYAYTSAPTDVSYLPAESDPAQALLIGWPSGVSGLSSYFAKLIKAAVPYVTTVVYVDSNYSYSQLSSALYQAGVDPDEISFVQMDLDTIWMRDYGPLLVRTTSGGYRVIDLRYYYGRWYDDVLPTQLAKAWNINVSRPPIEAEGGNIQSDGAGRCITTDQILYQNYSYTSSDVKTIFKKYLGCQTTVILPSLYGEGTGHVDMFATITGPKEVIVGKYSTSDDPTNAKVLDKAASMLKSAGFTVQRVPMPANWDGNFRSYTNSLAVGKVVMVPVYSDDRRYESQALSVFKNAYPYHKIVPIESSKIITWSGAIHCVTMTLGK